MTKVKVKSKTKLASCSPCEGRGFLWGTNPAGIRNMRIIERCDICRRFDCDQAAARAIVNQGAPWVTWGVIRDPNQMRVVTVVIAK